MNNVALFALLIAGIVGLSFTLGEPPGNNQVSFAFKNLPDLPPGFSYQAWVMDGQERLVSLGRFRHLGNARNFQFVGDLHRERRFLISVETGDPDGIGDLNGPAPDLILLAGEIHPVAPTAHLSLIAPDLKTPSGGVYVLQTPTDDSTHPRSKLKDGVAVDDDNDEQGIWFITPQAGGGIASGLALPRIPSENFVYEGWISNPRRGSSASTGRFLQPGMADHNSGQSPYDGGRVFLGYSEPGEDFVNPGLVVGDQELPLTLNNSAWQTAISIEPNSDGDGKPFVLVPWEASIGVGTGCLYDTVSAQPSPLHYQQQKCFLDPQYAGVAVIH